MKDYKDFIPGSGADPEEYGVFASSVRKSGKGAYVYTVRTPEGDRIVSESSAGFKGESFARADGMTCVLAEDSHENAELLRELFPFAAPSAVLAEKRTVGTGDRLGLATPGHLRAVSGSGFFPILAQQSVRELTLTGRTFEDVLDCASRAVFREGYTAGWGADGDHLKTPEEVEYALAAGYTMITLDCSAHIKSAKGMSLEELRAACGPYDALKEEYLGKDIELPGGIVIHMSEESLLRALVIYGGAVEFASRIYHEHIKGRPVDFEISIDETDAPTLPEHHYFAARELVKRGVEITTMAPRFCGEFQKGIDYIGDVEQFRSEMKVHAAVAKAFGYKISVHSGSDKFSVFPSVGELTEGHFHLKTAGTSWLEAVKLVSIKDPALYRELHAFALEHFGEATAYYHVTTDLDRVPPLESLSDGELPGLFENSDARQLIHITYGLILTAKKEDGSPLFRDRLYALWNTYEDDYAELLERHIGRHLSMLTGRC